MPTCSRIVALALVAALLLMAGLPLDVYAQNADVIATSTERHDWRWFAGYVLLALILAGGVWWVQQRKVELEADYSRRLEAEVRRRTQELNDRNEALARANERLLDASLTDPLTGLRNRRFLFEEVTRHVELIKRWQDDHGNEQGPFNLFLMIVDLDHFKSVNDSCGHPAGDQMLLQVRDVLLRSVRSSDFVVRWGGDEFVVVSRNARPEQVESLAERIRSEISREVFRLDDAHVVRSSCSIGFAGYPFIESDPDKFGWEQVLGLADSALYLAKEQRDCWVGYLGSDGPVRSESLFNTVRKDPLTAEDLGDIAIRASVPLRFREDVG
ncbi:MAG: diguanylate cyclase [Gammaproteobacteria bacterium]|nr:diguanylate cyclase [Gammaproteobacteria bacterium]